MSETQIDDWKLLDEAGWRRAPRHDLELWIAPDRVVKPKPEIPQAARARDRE